MALEKVVKKEILPGVFHLVFPTQRLMAETFLRPQEYYESPRFKDKIFSLEEFKNWYVNEYGSFTYVEDWPGFNIPSSALVPFYEGKFNPLSKEEQELLGMFRGQKESYYIIATSPENPPEYLSHEIAHALYHTDPEYRSNVSEIISSILPDSFKKIADMINIGYHESVIHDEVQAHLIANFEELVGEGLPEAEYISVKNQLSSLFEDRLPAGVIGTSL